MKLTQQEIAIYMIDVLGYSQEDIEDFNDDTSVYHNRLQDVLTEAQIREMTDYYSYVNK